MPEPRATHAPSYGRRRSWHSDCPFRLQDRTRRPCPIPKWRLAEVAAGRRFQRQDGVGDDGDGAHAVVVAAVVVVEGGDDGGGHGGMGLHPAR